MSETTPDGGTAAVRPPGASPGAPDAEAAILAELAQDYQTHCAPCFLGMPEHCTEGLAPNGQPCVTTPAQRIAWLLDVVQQVVAQRNTADVENAALTARLAAAEAERDRLRRAYVEVAIPLEGFWAAMAESKWLAPEVRTVLVEALTQLRCLVLQEPPDGR